MNARKPVRGEIWLVEFEPQIGSEIQKTRPAIVISIEETKFLPTRTIVPIRNYKESQDGRFFYIVIEPNTRNGLSKKSMIDCIQVKSFDVKRFQKKLGKLLEKELEEIVDTVSMTIGKF